jgi:hypothetical protein
VPRYAALALVPLLGLLSPVLPPVPLLLSGDGLLSVVVFDAPSAASVFSAGFVSLAFGFASVVEDFFEP